MNARGTAGRLGVAIAVIVLLSGCGGGASPTLGPPTATPVSLASGAVATSTAEPTPAVVVTTDVVYEPAAEGSSPSLLDVYAPAGAGQWPVVVMLNGAGDKRDIRSDARGVAGLGFVVFAPTWGEEGAPTYDRAVAYNARAACAVAFAQATAAQRGGDPATLIVFGWSAGANVASMVAFSRPVPTPGCLGGDRLGAIDALVTREGDWLLSVAQNGWDDILAADPRVVGVATPWRYLAAHKDLRVVILVSDHPGAMFERPVGDPWAAGSWLAVRDPSGALRRQLEANGALADGTFDYVDGQRLFFSVLQAQGNPVSLHVMPGSTHTFLSADGWKVFLAAFPEAAGRA